MVHNKRGTIKGELLRCMHELVPKKEEKNKKQPLWMNKRIKKLIKGRNRASRNFKDRPSYVNQMKYKKRRNEVCNEIKEAKKSIEYRLASNIKEDPKTFYAYVTSRSRSRSGIGTLRWRDEIVEADEGNA